MNDSGLTAIELCLIVLILIVLLWAFGVIPK